MKTPTAKTLTALTNKIVAKEIRGNETVKNWQHCQEFKIYKIYKDSINFYDYILQCNTMYAIVLLKKGDKHRKFNRKKLRRIHNKLRNDILLRVREERRWIK